jgi:ankyrin repeat protein
MWTLRKALDALPPGLDETYSRILGKVNEHEKPSVRLMLQWLCFSFRPLLIEELAHIVHIGDTIGPPFNPDTVVFCPEDVLDICPGLLSHTVIDCHFIEGNMWRFFQLGTMVQIIQLAHFSVKEYLLQSPPRDHSTSWLALNQELAHLSILKSSMAYHMSVATELRDDTQSPSRTWHDFAISHSLLVYAGEHTDKHISALTYWQREHPDLLESFRRLLNPHSEFLTHDFALTYFHPMGIHLAELAASRERAPAIGMGLLLAARLGLIRMVEWLLSFDGDDCTEGDNNKCDINFCYANGWRRYGPALAEAACHGHLDVVKRLLDDQRLDVDRRIDKYHETALHRAAYYGHEDIVRLLINAGADINIKHVMTGGALHCASYQQNVNIVHMLLTHGADVNAIRGTGGCIPLQIAIWQDQKQVAQILIDAGANVDYVGEVSGFDPFAHISPLLHAVRKGSIDLVRMLLDAKADIRAVGETVLLWTAVDWGHEDITEFFLESGADITRHTKTVALAKARELHYDTIAAMLLGAGADPVEAEKIDLEQWRFYHR